MNTGQQTFELVNHSDETYSNQQVDSGGQMEAEQSDQPFRAPQLKDVLSNTQIERVIKIETMYAKTRSGNSLPSEQRQNVKAKVGRYVVTKTVLGKGGFGKVFQAWKIDSDLRIVAKCIKLRMIDKGRFPEEIERIKKNLQREIELNQALQKHGYQDVRKYVVQCYDVIQTTRCIYFFLEHCDYTLQKFIDKSVFQDFSHLDILKFLSQLSSGIYYLQSIAHIVHRDLKLENIMVSKPQSSGESYRLKICDFGFSKHEESEQLLSQTTGTYVFNSPEQLDRLHKKQTLSLQQ